MKVEVKQEDGKSRVIGNWDEDNRIFSKSIDSRKHVMRETDAIGIDADYFTNNLKNKSGATVEITEIDTGTIYTAPAQDFVEYGHFLHFKPYRAQIFLPRKLWEQRNLPV